MAKTAKFKRYCDSPYCKSDHRGTIAGGGIEMTVVRGDGGWLWVSPTGPGPRVVYSLSGKVALRKFALAILAETGPEPRAKVKP